MSASSNAHIKRMNIEAEDKHRGGACYQDAWRLMMTIRDTFPSPSARLVHGRVFSEFFNRYIPHAWVRLNEDVVCDPSSRWVGRAEKWERLSRCRVDEEFTPDEAPLFALRTGHYGPWQRGQS